MIADSNQTGMNDFGDRAAEVVTPGMRRVKKVETCTGVRRNEHRRGLSTEITDLLPTR